jgi:alkyl hydroperoxide reductase subunit AhpC
VATLLLADRATPDTGYTSGTVQQTLTTLTSPSLRTWLREAWAILFSHPDDFVRCDLEMDRWLVVARRAFAERDVRPIALASPKLDPNRNWVTQVSGDDRTVLLEDPARQHFGPVDLQTPVLREEIERSDRRFVMIIDSALRKQKMFTYDTPANLPSPLEFLGWAEALRSKQVEALHDKRVPAAEANSTLVCALPHPFFVARRHKHQKPQVACIPMAHARAG